MGLSELGGANRGHFFEIVGPHVDRAKAPGASPLPPPSMPKFILDAILLRHMWASPNLIWCLIAIAIYVSFPYDLGPDSIAAQAPLSIAFFKSRIALWLVVVMGYVSFWHVTTHVLGWAKRSFIPNRTYRIGKVLHNIFYCVTGTAIWVGFENVFAFLWATGRIPYMTDTEAMTTPVGMARMFLGLVLVPLWRDFHFYFAHRLLHFRPMFLQVHSLHHRNTDVEPFSGLCMHPIEHLYYYTSALPSLFLYASPLHCLWNAVHFLLAPFAGHSGYEDHWQADVFHYYHHRYFECNYAGGAASYLDVWFGSYHGNGWKEKDGVITVREDSKADVNILKNPPTLEYLSYMGMSVGCVLSWVVAPSPSSAVVAGFGPVLVAVIFLIVKEGPGTLIYPFQKRPLWETLFHIVMGTAFCSVPVTYACWISLV